MHGKIFPEGTLKYFVNSNLETKDKNEHFEIAGIQNNSINSESDN